MARHLTIRLPWHDRGWDGRICDDPKGNVYCTGAQSCSGEMLRKYKDAFIETQFAGKEYDPKVYIPPCSQWINTFADKTLQHRHIPPDFLVRETAVTMDIVEPSTTGTWPYLEVANKEMNDDDAKSWLPYDDRLENIEGFFGDKELISGESIVFFYMKFDNPFNEENQKFLLVGATKLKEIGDPIEWEGMSDRMANSEVGNQVWVRWIKHYATQSAAIFPLASLYRLIKSGKLKKSDLENILPEVPSSLNDGFRFVTRKFEASTAIVFLDILKNSFLKLKDSPFAADINVDANLNWLNSAISECWEDRGSYPGLGSILEWLGHPQGTNYYRDVLKPLEENGKRPIDELKAILNEIVPAPSDQKRKFKTAIEKWKALPSDDFRNSLLNSFSRFMLSKDQLNIILDQNSSKREQHGLISKAEVVLENPYVLTEEMLLDGDTIPFALIDQGLCPAPNVGYEALFEPEDSDRLRAIAFGILREEASKGHTWTPESILIERMNNLSTSNHPLAIDAFRLKSCRDPWRKKISYLSNVDGYALNDLEQDEQLIAKFLSSFEGQFKLSNVAKRSEKYWRSKLDFQPPSKVDVSEVIADQASACSKAYLSKISAICGGAGTGKTSTLRALIDTIADNDSEEVVQLAFTGRAVQILRRKTGREAMTVHRFLMDNEWLWPMTYLPKRSGGNIQEVTNLVIDEASMLDLQLFASLLRSINWKRLKRIIFVGDPYQLPPIGPGRLFVDILSALNPTSEIECEQIGFLSRNVRQLSENSQCIELASAFRDAPIGDISDIVNDVFNPKREEIDLRVVFFDEPNDLLEKLTSELKQELKNHYDDFDEDRIYYAFNDWMGIGPGQSSNLERFQILSPFRKLEGLGTDDTNIHIQSILRGGFLNKRGLNNVSGFTIQDKIMINKNMTFYSGYNHETKEGKVRIDLANGQFGQVIKLYSREVRGDKVFPKRAMVKFPEVGENVTLNVPAKMASEIFELGYATTIHKAQGSEFEVVFMVLPLDASWLVSRELIYTALTRSTSRIVLFLRGDIELMKKSLSPANSDIGSRRTRPLHGDDWHPNLYTQHITAKGLQVISKSECIIANLMDSQGLEYEYNYELKSRDGKSKRWVDFMVRVGDKQVYWEHAGMFSQKAYLRKHKFKLDWYEKQGLLKQLLVSDEVNGFDSERMKKVIILLKNGDLEAARKIFDPTLGKKSE